MTRVSLYIATLLPPSGSTGVQTHIKMSYDLAKCSGLADVNIITPYGTSKLIRGPLRRLGSLVGSYDKELGILSQRQFLYLLLCRQISRLPNRHNLKTIVYAQDPLSAKAALNLKHNGDNVDVVLTVHFNISQAWEVVQRQVAREGGVLSRNLLQLEQQIIPKVDRLIFVSRFSEKTVLERIPEANRVPRWIIANTISDQEVTCEGTMQADLITIGTIEPRKNQMFVIRVLAEAHRLGHKYTMTIVGDGECKRKLMNLVHQLRLDEYIKFAGYVPNASELIPKHKVYVHASFMENLPIVLLEALSCGRPVFAAPVGGIPEIFDDGVEGFYWNLQAPETAARQIVAVLEDNEVYRKMSTAARVRYEGHFTPTTVASTLLDAILDRRISEEDVRQSVGLRTPLSQTRTH